MAPQGRLSSLAFGGLFLLYHAARSVGVACFLIDKYPGLAFFFFFLLFIILTFSTFHIGHFVVIVLRMTQ